MYKWDINDINNEIKKYRILKQRTKSLSKRQDIQSTIYSFLELKDYYKIMTSNNKGKKQSVYYSINDDLDNEELVYLDSQIIRLYGMYAPIVRKLIETFYWEQIEREKELPLIHTDEERLVLFTSELYKNVGGFYYDTFRQLEKNFNSRLMFNKLNSSLICSGFTHPIYRTDRVYIDCGINSTIQDYVSLIHESSHGITSLANQDIMFEEEKYCFMEVDSLFFEMIGTDYISDKIGHIEDGVSLKRTTFIDYLYNADLICTRMDMHSALSERDLLNDKRVSEYLKNETNFNRTAIKDVKTTYIKDYFNYLVSYLTAIELYLIYQSDKDYAVELLRKIIMLKGLSPASYLNSIRNLGINPGLNITKYYDMIAPKGGFSYVKKI